MTCTACTACTDAMTSPRSATFTPSCESCIARALAATGAHQESARVESITPAYRAALVALFGERAMEGQALTLEWAARIKAADLRAPPVKRP